jgi:phage terminase small subunit
MTKRPRTPAPLAGKRLITAVDAEFDIEAYKRPVLEAAALHADRAAAFREVIEAEGAVITNRFGARVVHPAVDAERKALDAMRLLLRELGLALDENEARPPHIHGRYVQEG